MSTQMPPGHLYGDTLMSRKVVSFDLSERAYPPRFRTPRHSHKRALFCFVIQGEYAETYGPRTRECRSSTVLFHPAGELHAEHFHDSGGRSFIVEIEPPWLERVREHFDMKDNSIDLAGGDFESLARRLYAVTQQRPSLDRDNRRLMRPMLRELTPPINEIVKKRDVVGSAPREKHLVVRRRKHVHIINLKHAELPHRAADVACVAHMVTDLFVAGTLGGTRWNRGIISREIPLGSVLFS